MEDIAELVTAGRATGGRSATWLGLTEALLRYCDDHQHQLHRDRLEAGDPAGDDIKQLAHEWAARLQPFSAETRLTDGAQELIIELLERDAHLEPPVLARALALAVDESCHPTFLERFHARNLLELAPGEAHPVQRYDPREVMAPGASASTPPDHLPTRDLSAVPHLRLGGDELERYRVVIDFDSHDRLAPLSRPGGLTYGAVQPSLSLAEFNVEYGDVNFTNHGPKDKDGHTSRVVDLVRRAAEAGADVVVVPEYCLVWDHRDRMREAAQALHREYDRPILLVAGTSAVVDGNGTVNRAAIWELSGPEVREVPADKIHPAPIYVDDHAQPGQTEKRKRKFLEAIRPSSEPPKVGVRWSGKWAYAIAICRDSMDRHLVKVLSDIGVNMLLVPAMSEPCQPLLDGAAHLATDAQAFVVVANAPAAWTREEVQAVSRDGGRIEAGFVGPYATDREHVAPSGADGSSDGRGVWHFRTDDRTIGFAEL